MTRLEELEIWIENQKRIDGKKFSTRCNRYPEFNEYLTLKARNEMAAREQQKIQQKFQSNNEPATDNQKAYLVKLGVVVEAGLTKRHASELIDATKSGRLGSVGGWYRDGSN